MKNVIDEAYKYAKSCNETGTAAAFIPAISNIDLNLLAVCFTDINGNGYYSGDYEYRFTVQSISKAITYMFACMDVGRENVEKKVGIEPCGDHFNDVYKLEKMDHRPANPFVNAGAIAMASCIKGKDVEEKYARLHSFAAKLFDNPNLDYSKEVCKCETETAHKNRAIAYMLKDYGIYDGNPDEYLELYYRACAFFVNAKEVSFLGAVLANDGKNPKTQEEIVPKELCGYVRALMASCGMYERTGWYNLKVGIPSKSGSSGIIVASARGKGGLSAYSPGIDSAGNSVRGTEALAYISQKLDWRQM